MCLKAYQRERATEETILFLFQTAGRACELWLCWALAPFALSTFQLSLQRVPARCSHPALPLQMRFSCAPLQQQWQHQTPHSNADLIPFSSFFFCGKQTKKFNRHFYFSHSLKEFPGENETWFHSSAGDLSGVSVDLKWEFLSQSCDWNTTYL